MSRAITHLPVLQNWDCHGCGDCCREYEVHVTEAEKAKILAQGWQDDADFAHLTLFVRVGSWWRKRWRLNTRPGDDACIFLNAEGRCRIHARFGSDAKPLACQVYPFTFTPVGQDWRIGLRFACPSVTSNRGRHTSAHLADLRAYGRGLEDREQLGDREAPTPPLQTGQRLGWTDLERVADGLLAILQHTRLPLERRLRLGAALAELCRKAKFDKVTGERLTEFLEVVPQGLMAELPARGVDVPPPSRIGRILFRQTVAIYARRDTGPRRGISRHGRIALLRAALRFARGTGPVPRVHGLLPETTFEAMEEPDGGLSEDMSALLTRYYQVKIESLQFCGPTNFNLGFWAGLESLLLTFPAIRWLSRAFRDRSRDEAVQLALRIVDDNFGYNRLLGSSRQRLANRILASRGEISRLIAWYDR